MQPKQCFKVRVVPGWSLKHVDVNVQIRIVTSKICMF